MDEDVELRDGVLAELPARRPPQHVPRRHPEPPRAADHRQLAQLLQDVVAPRDLDRFEILNTLHHAIDARRVQPY